MFALMPVTVPVNTGLSFGAFASNAGPSSVEVASAVVVLKAAIVAELSVVT